MRKTLITVFLFLLTASLCAAVTIEVWEYGMANEFVAIIQELADLEFTPKTGIEVNLVANPYEGMQNKVLWQWFRDPPDVLSGAADTSWNTASEVASFQCAKSFRDGLKR